VAANLRFRELLEERARAQDLGAFFPPVELCTDNGAMVAAAGYHLLKESPEGSVADFDAYSRKAGLKENPPGPRPAS
jgi:N6-L-threonylcarbamoyladenine synthase